MTSSSSMDQKTVQTIARELQSLIASSSTSSSAEDHYKAYQNPYAPNARKGKSKETVRNHNANLDELRRLRESLGSIANVMEMVTRREGGGNEGLKGGKLIRGLKEV